MTTKAHRIVTVTPSVCPKCGSTNRTKYVNVKTTHYRGVTPDGREYNRVVRKRTTCKDCGQQRIDRYLESDGAEGYAKRTPTSGNQAVSGVDSPDGKSKRTTEPARRNRKKAPSRRGKRNV